MSIPKYSNELLQKAVINSISYSDVIKYINAGANGTTLTWIKNRIKILKIDTSHFKKYFLNHDFNKKSSLEILVKSEKFRRTESKQLRRALLEIGRPYKCENCYNIGQYNGKNLILQIDHIDGDFRNNIENNLRFLCPNCHSQTNGHSGRKIKQNKIMIMVEDINEKLKNGMNIEEISIELNITPKTIRKYCIKFNLIEVMDNRRRDRKYISKEEILEKIKISSSLSDLSSKLNITPQSLKKKCEKYNILNLLNNLYGGNSLSGKDKIKFLFKGKKRNYKWITNGEKDTFHNLNDPMPDGWYFGKTFNKPPINKIKLENKLI